MDERAVAAVLAALPPDVLLWRGEDLGGGDVDLVVPAGAGPAVREVLAAHGLVPAPQEPGRVLWRRLPDHDVVLDVTDAHAWPSLYPPLEQVGRRAAPSQWGPAVASGHDRMLVHAAEAVAGRPLAQVQHRLRSVAAEPGAARSLLQAAASGRGLVPLARLACELAARDARPAGEVLPLRRAVLLAARSPQARAALRRRLVGDPVRLPPGGAGRPLLVALSGMDGAGKSSTALRVVEHLEARGEPVAVCWSRLGRDLGVLHHVGRVARSVLGRREALSREQRPAGPAPAPAPEPTSAPAPSRLAGAWSLALALANVRTVRRAARWRKAGCHVVCDRWWLDAHVDLQVRYGAHPVARHLLARGYPAADLWVLLRVDAGTAATRKPGDRHPEVLARMQDLYRPTGRPRLVEVDASRPVDEVAAEVVALVDRARADGITRAGP